MLFIFPKKLAYFLATVAKVFLKIYLSSLGLAMKGFLDKIATCQYVKDLVTNSLTAEDENTENDKPPKDKDACVKEDPKVANFFAF